MLFVIRFTDKPDGLNIRRHHLEAHLSWLDQRRESVLAAGSLRHEQDSTPIGALWVVEADSRAEAAELFTTDPFYTNGLRERVEILHWSKAFADEKSTV